MDRLCKTVEERYTLDEMSETCPYLPGRTSRMRFLDGRRVGMAYRKLLDEGYRRTGAFVYRPICEDCHACEVLRVPVAEFKRSKSQRRVWNKGRTFFDIQIGTPEMTDEKIDLYRKYLREKHQMHHMTVTEEEYAFVFVLSSLGEGTKEIQLRADGKLVGLGIVDCIADAMSSVYFYYDTDFSSYSPGTFSVLAELHLAETWNLRYYYLGHYISQCDAMNYKANYRPCEIRSRDSEDWRRVE